MSGPDRKRQDKLHTAALRGKLDAEVWRDPRDWLAMARWACWHRPYFERCPENAARDQNQGARAHLSRYLDEVAADEAPDGHLGSRLGLRKRSGQAMQFYGRTSEIEAQRWGTKIRCSLDCRGASIPQLKKAFDRIDNVQLRQMQNAQLRAAGIVLEAIVSADGWVDLVAVVTDPVAMKKVSDRAYTGVLVAFDDDVISDISVVDSPLPFIEKAGRPGGGNVICKIYGGGTDVKDWKRAKKMTKCYGGTPAENYAALKAVRKSLAPAGPLWPSAQAVINEINRTEEVLKNGTCGDRLAAQAQNARARGQYGVEYIKAIRANPSNQLGGPRYHR